MSPYLLLSLSKTKRRNGFIGWESQNLRVVKCKEISDGVCLLCTVYDATL